jgi:hypothetical protein
MTKSCVNNVCMRLQPASIEIGGEPMRLSLSTFVVSGLFLVACGDDTTSGGGDSGAGVRDLSAVAGGDLAGTAADLAGTVGGGDGGNMVSADAGGAGASCQSACDCMPGLGCFGGKCVSGQVPVYCCGAPSCMTGHICQNPDGSYGQCGGGGGMRDMAMFDFCHLISCSGPTGTQACANAGCTGQCVPSPNGAGMVCNR